MATLLHPELPNNRPTKPAESSLGMLTGKPAPFGTSAARKSPMADAIKQNPLLAGAGSKGNTALNMLDRGKLSLLQALIYTRARTLKCS